MMSVTKYACALALASGLAGPVFAAQGDAGNGPASGAAGSGPAQGDASSQNDQSAIYNGNRNGKAAMRIGQALRTDLSKAGYTDITIMPTSFMVRAKDSQGNPVTMVISPDSVTAITQENDANTTASNAKHNAAGATPGPASTGESQPTQGDATKP